MKKAEKAAATAAAKEKRAAERALALEAKKEDAKRSLTNKRKRKVGSNSASDLDSADNDPDFEC